MAPWEKDYFTTSRPWPQKGDAVTIPISGTAPVKGIGIKTSTFVGVVDQLNVREAGGTGTDSTTYPFAMESNADTVLIKTNNNTSAQYRHDVYVDLDDASAEFDVNDFRQAMAQQMFKEMRAQYGSRYSEYLRYLGVRSSDARLQRPEYLGGGRNVVQFSEVLQTAEGENPVGTLTGHGIAVTRSNKFLRFFEEHGHVITLLSVVPKTMYQQGIPRAMTRFTKDDYWQKENQIMGQQEVLNKEIYAAAASPDGVFGYQDRHDEYRRSESSVTGEFRTILNDWHMGRIFSSPPALNADFVKSNPTKRVFAVQTNDVLWIKANHSIQARRLVRKNAKPGNLV